MGWEITVGWICIITGAAILLVQNLNWQFIISKIKERM